MNNRKTGKIVMSSMFAALCCVATMIIKIPSPFKGYLNLGDCIVLLSGWLLPGGYGFLAAGIGSALADLFSGFVIYSPATFVIKGVMALVAYYCQRGMKAIGTTPSRVIGAILAEVTMVLGYFVFEGIIYGFGPSALNIPANAIQGAAGLVIAMSLVKIFEKTKMF